MHTHALLRDRKKALEPDLLPASPGLGFVPGPGCKVLRGENAPSADSQVALARAKLHPLLSSSRSPGLSPSHIP